MLRAPTTALASPGGVAAASARARVAARARPPPRRRVPRRRGGRARADGSTSNTFKMMSASRLSRGAVRVSASASASAPDAGAPGAADDADAALASSPRLYPHLELDFTPRLSLAALASCVACSWAAVVAYAVLFSKFHLRHYTLSLKALYLEVFSFAIVGAAAFWVVKTALAEAQEQARLVPAAAAADPDSLFAAIDGLRVHYKRRDGDTRHGDERIVVSCVHGFGANTYSWERAALDPLAERLGATAVAHDAPGFGLTERSSDLARYTARTNAAIARAMLDLAEQPPGGSAEEISARESETYENKTWNDVVGEMETSQADGPVSEKKKKKKSDARRVVVGHSMGGVAAAVAAAEGDVDDVILVAPAVIAAPPGNEKDARGNAAGATKKTPLAALLAAAARALRVVLAAASPVLTLALRKLVRWRRFGATGSAGPSAPPPRARARGRDVGGRTGGPARWPAGTRGWCGSCCRRPPGA